jgi:hypothetical protein
MRRAAHLKVMLNDVRVRSDQVANDPTGNHCMCSCDQTYEFIGFGAMDVTKPHEFIGFGAMDVTKPYAFIGSGAMDVPNPINS